MSASLKGAIRVACATDSGELIDGHFGSCRAFLVYQVSPETVEFVNALSTAAADEAEDRNKARAALIDGCQIACFQSIGGPAAAKVVRAGT
ncbi:MAG: NifB/NifX family molybdenum-iron cluster-binding protein, partial [Rhodocyclaceae bacterium]|nr:NifB/NifX family molybdenum-iron cluster-binding protein [Rhodocyclaceae bacterium]